MKIERLKCDFEIFVDGNDGGKFMKVKANPWVKLFLQNCNTDILRVLWNILFYIITSHVIHRQNICHLINVTNGKSVVMSNTTAAVRFRRWYQRGKYASCFACHNPFAFNSITVLWLSYQRNRRKWKRKSISRLNLLLAAR